MITQDKLNNIHKLPLSDVLLIFRECAEALGVSDMDTAEKIIGKSKRRIYQLLSDKNSVNVGTHKIILINCF